MSETELSWDGYWRPSVAVDVAVLTVAREVRAGQLCVLLHQPPTGHAAGSWALPGVFLQEDELLTDAAFRALKSKAGVRGRRPRQLEVFDAFGRDDRGRVLSVAHVDLVPEHRLTPGERAQVVPVDERTRNPVIPDRQRTLPYDHDRIVRHAVLWARSRYEDRADPDRLLGDTFTLYELRRLHEAVLGRVLQKDNFRRAMRDQVVGLGEIDARGGTVGKPAELHRRATLTEIRAARDRRTSRSS